MFHKNPTAFHNEVGVACLEQSFKAEMLKEHFVDQDGLEPPTPRL